MKLSIEIYNAEANVCLFCICCLYKAVWQIPKLIVMACKKNNYCSNLVLSQSFYCLRWNVLSMRVVHLMIETHFIILMCKWSYSFIYYGIAEVVFSYQLNYRFFMSSGICAKYREYWMLHETWYCFHKVFIVSDEMHCW